MARAKKVQITDYWHNIPTYDGSTEKWSSKSFNNKADFRSFAEDIFIEDGPETGYAFDESAAIFNAEATKFLEEGHFCDAPDMSKDFLNYWRMQSERCRNGVIVYGKNGRTWYLTRDYYMWINFLPIYHKEKRVYQFPDIYDGQYHTALYETLAELKSKHAVILKKRQYAMSYYHMAKLINQIWFEEGVTLKLLAYADSFIGAEGSWAFLNEYRDFLNDKTAWYRNFEPDKVGSWLQRIKTTINGRDVYRGRKGRIIGVTTQQSPTRGVGGASRFIIYEESGIAPTLDKTYGYAKSALEAGPFSITGQFIAYGSVGDLKQCEPLKMLMNKPEENGFFGVKTKLYDDKEVEKLNGLFIPETWNMIGFMDEHGNSDTKGAKKALLEKRVQQKKDLEPEAYQLEVSQHPLTISEAFDWREEAIFPLEYVAKQIQRIEDGEYPSEFIDLYEDEKGTVISKLSKDRPIMVFPVDKKMVNKEGVIVVYERPDPKPAWGTYYSSIDPVGAGQTTSSDSLCSIIVYKNPIEVIKHQEDGTVKSHIEGDKIVCTWCGRFNDLNKTHERLEFIIRWYNAWSLCEANVALFIQHMINRKMQHFLVPKDQILFLKELTSNNGFHEYGWKNVSTIFKNNLLPYGIQFLKDEINIETEVDGTVIRIHFGVERIPDKMLLVEMKEYRSGMNVDRIISYVALVAFVKIQQANRGFMKKIEYTKNLEKPINYSRLKLNPFRHIGGSATFNTSADPQYRIKRSAFNNYR
jgi:hypothetical protein